MVTQTLFITQNTDFSIDLQLTNDDGSELNIAEYVFSGSIRPNPYSNNIIKMGVNVINNTYGNVQFTVPAAQTAGMAISTQQYSIMAYIGGCGGGSIPILSGDVVVIGNMNIEQPLPHVPPKLYDDEFVCEFAGQKDFFLSFTPANVANVAVSLTEANNSINYPQTINVEYVLVGTNLSFTTANGCNVGDLIEAQETVYNY